MTTDEIVAALAGSLEDHRLSRSERGMLLGMFQEVHEELGRVELRRLALEVARASAEQQGPAVLDWLEGVLKLLDRLEASPPPKDIAEAHFSPGETCAARIIQFIESARERLDICVFTITDDRISRAIVEVAGRGVAVRIVTDNEKAGDEGSDIEWFRQARIPLRMDHTQYHMHHKFALVDDELLLSGSYNWTRGASLYNDENFIITGDRRLIAAFSRTFEHLWEKLK
jgi:phosphatidylserine/phosphatidylglycerophosphate/cardiolipin synthase-like enzyme